MDVKKCRTCGQEKELSEFSAHRGRHDGKNNECLDCNRTRSLIWSRLHAQRNRERVQAYLAIKSGRASAVVVRLKRCTRCDGWKLPGDFGTNGSGCRRSECGECRRARERTQRRDNLDEKRRRDREQYAKSRQQRRRIAAKHRVKRVDRINDYMRGYYQRTKAERQRRHKEWCQKNPESVRQYAATTRARKRKVPGNLTYAEWHQILETFDGCCAYCLQPSVSLTQDHVIPLSRGGEHSLANVVPACRRCNGVKKDRSLLQIARINGLGSHGRAATIRRGCSVVC